jgi:hypothetical protein
VDTPEEQPRTDTGTRTDRLGAAARAVPGHIHRRRGGRRHRIRPPLLPPTKMPRRHLLQPSRPKMAKSLGKRERAEQAEGRADRAERRSDRAEAALQAERSRADVLIWAACRRPLSSQTSARRKAKSTGRSAGLNHGSEESQQSMGMGLTLSDWFHEGILMDGGLLSFDPVYSRSRVAANAGFTASRVSTRAGRGRKASSVSWSKTCRD